MTKRWSAAMVRTRDTHQHLHGQTIPIDEAFELSDGDKLNYPGDPNGRSENIINCRCRLIYEVADEEKSKEDKKADYIIAGDFNNDIVKSLENTFGKLADYKVILINERLEHIRKHNDVFNEFTERKKEIIENPDKIYLDTKFVNTIILQRLSITKTKNINIAIKLSTIKDFDKTKPYSSIITVFFRKSEIKDTNKRFKLIFENK